MSHTTRDDLPYTCDVTHASSFSTSCRVQLLITNRLKSSANMDSEGPSSPLAMPSSLPPSSAPDPLGSVRGGTPRRPAVDALTLEDDEDGEPGTGAPSRKRRRPRTQANGEVPLVKDAVGESVAESFETFLKT